MSSIADRSSRHPSPGIAIAALAAAAFSFALYLGTLAPSISWDNNSGDSGELAAAIVTGGIAHPTGYPLYVLLGRLVVLAPGDPSHALNVFSACCAALCVALVAWLAACKTDLKSFKTRALAAALTSGATLALSGAFWSQAVVTETRALACALIALVLLLCFYCAVGALHPAVLMFMLGLSLADHVMAVVLVPGAIFIALAALRRRRWHGWLSTVAVAGVGPALYLYLPLRAAASPAMNWGDPSSPARLWWVISGAQYHDLLGWGDGGALAALTSTAGALKEQVGIVAVLLACLGAVKTARVSWQWLTVLLSSIAFSVIVAAGDQAEAGPYYILPALLCVALLAGRGAAALVDYIRMAAGSSVRLSNRLRLAAIIVLAAGFVAYSVPRWRSGNDLVSATQQSAALASGQRGIQSLAPRAVVFVQGDDYTFPLWYAHYALHEHPDAAIVNVNLLRWQWYASHAARDLGVSAAVRRSVTAPRPELGGDDLAAARMTILARAELPRRPVYLQPEQYVLLQFCKQVEAGDLFRCLPGHA